MNATQLKKLIETALAEDLGWGDVTTSSALTGSEKGKAVVMAKDDMIVAGLEVFATVFHCVDPSLVLQKIKNDGDLVIKGEIIAEIRGNLGHILRAERVGLNILQRLCGIATETGRYVTAVKDTRARIVDTRKTLPGFRVLDKYAVTVGGGHNHRFGLSDGILIKDNHIDAAGGITEAVSRCRRKAHHLLKIEVECRNLDEVKEALACGADVLMLDNMSVSQMKEAVALANGKVPLEASGNVNHETVRDIAATGVDFISVGAITHSVKAADISLLIEKEG
ncbi:MAG: carboxylating nicotinate-nucleotide diphosphorylase [Deltaproteobacteria bacterium]|nr:carboxylating nicotinate-nucleotide diphosphorylase [Deltaproteobacteria bacterium]